MSAMVYAIRYEDRVHQNDLELGTANVIKYCLNITWYLFDIHQCLVYIILIFNQFIFILN